MGDAGTQMGVCADDARHPLRNGISPTGVRALCSPVCLPPFVPYAAASVPNLGARKFGRERRRICARFAPAGGSSDMPRRWMPAEDGLEGPNDLMLRAVEGQRGNRRPAAGGEPHDRAADPSEVMIPLLIARVKQPHREAGGGIARRLPRAFAQRTVNEASARLANTVAPPATTGTT